jgi:ferredoxin-NADP reductase
LPWSERYAVDIKLSTAGLDAARLATLAWPPADRPACFVCGPTGFVEAFANLLVDQGQDPQRIKIERFGPSGS